MQPGRDIDVLLAIMAALRTPGSGCPWDLEQTFASIVPYTIEEAYEVADAIERGDTDDLADELGDLLLQVVFHARMAEEQRAFDFGDVVLAITRKLVRRHPHVFGDARRLAPEAVKTLWASIKAREKAERRDKRAAAGLPEETGQRGVLAGVPQALPALTRAVKLQTKASGVGFDWSDARLALQKVKEETRELEDALADGANAGAAAEELGDLLFSVANVARLLSVDPEAATRSTNAKFERRFAHIEAALEAGGRTPAQSTLEEMDDLWNAAKAAERAAAPTSGLRER